MTATWTAPRTWVNNELVNAALLNAHVRDNFDFLRTPPSGVATVSSNISTTSTAYVDLTGATVTFTTQGGRIMAFFMGILGVAVGPVDEVVSMGIAVDGALVGVNQCRLLSTGVVTDTKPMIVIARSGVLSAGSHTVKVQWLSAAGATVTVKGASAAAQLFAVEAWY